ncbi:PREDICTED: acyl carrier protein 2, mitochondrial-like [Nelumbo nucifera]|uniref:Acyl carrier protein n=2 Tax=Nelumbo nucifera TaxID=4432 RepID=A0A822ZVQ7_NELNU|nr:PREDICTED: acyl carrier protein 2, mitochondrial-like [Nelumbo nucifera]DAD48580.1 TPA_asm: hypothetical protein HUJ06_018517 [Nelumbo nucifera]
MQAIRAATRSLRSSSSSSGFASPSILSHYINGVSPATFVIPKSGGFDAEGGSILGFISGARVFSQSAVCSSASFLGKQEVTTRVVDLLKSIPFIDPAMVSPTANFRDDMQLDMLDNVEVIIAVEEEFAIDIPDSEANKFSTTAHLIDYIATHPQAK